MAETRLAVLATLAVRPEAAADFEVAMRQLRGEVVAAEPGCLRYDIARGPQPGQYRIFELYRSAADFVAHNVQPHVAQAAEAMGAALAAPPVIDVHEVLD